MARSTTSYEPLSRVLSGLARGSAPAILVTRFDPDAGEDLLSRDQLLQAVRRAVLGEASAVFAETDFDAPSVDLVEILDAAREVSLLTPRRLVLVRGGKLAGNTTEGGDENGEGSETAGHSVGRSGGPAEPRGGVHADKDAARLAVLERYLASASGSACIVFLGCPWDGRRRIHKAVLSSATVVDLSRPDARDVQGRIEDLVRRAGASIDADAAALLAELRGNDTLRLANEIEKLVLHSEATGAISREEVLTLVGASEATSAWVLGEALADGDASQAVQALRRLLAEGQAPPMIVGAIASRLRQLIVLRDERSVGRANEAARKTVFPGRSIYFADALARKSERFPGAGLTESLASLYDVDRRLKSSAVDPGALIEEWLLATLRLTNSVRSS